MNLRHLRYFTVLAQEGHFGRAAAACHVSQPALSMAIRKLESELGVRLVRRDAAGMVGLTDAGTVLVERARLVVAGAEGIDAEATRLRGRLTATLRLGTVPTGVAAVPTIIEGVLRAHSGVRVEVRTGPGDGLARAVARHEIDAALVYENGSFADVAVRPLYRERFVLVRRSAGDGPEPAGGEAGPEVAGVEGRPGTTAAGDGPESGPGPEGAVSWAAVAELPLCLLTPEMQHRTIVDEALRAAGVRVRPRVEADSFALLLGLVRRGWPTVIGHTWLHDQHLPAGVVVRAITGPAVERTVALLTAADGPPAPVVRALHDALRDVDVGARLGDGLPASAPGA